MVNASISGETTAGGAARIDGELKRNKPAVVVIELGANDGLRGLPLAQTRAQPGAHDPCIEGRRREGAADRHAHAAEPGPRIHAGFRPTTTRALAKQYDVALLPFLLEPIALDRNAFQADNLHPVASAQPKLRDHVWKALAPLLQ